MKAALLWHFWSHHLRGKCLNGNMTKADAAQIKLESSHPSVSVKDVGFNVSLREYVCFRVSQNKLCSQTGWLPSARRRCLVALSSVLYGWMAPLSSRWERWDASRCNWPLSFFLSSILSLSLSASLSLSLSRPSSVRKCTLLLTAEKMGEIAHNSYEK